MNTKDFVVLPWGKPGHSVKLKYKHAQELRMEKVQLELENQEMEKKLQEFQTTWNKEKEEIKSNGYHWKSGKVGKLGNQSHTMSQNKGNAIKISSGKVKLKLLKQQIQEPVKQAVNHTMANSRENEKPKIKGKVCGQCEKNAAFLVCLECGEDYCSGCFAKIHHKGALRLHRTTLFQAKSQIISNVLDVAHRFIKEVNPDESKGGNNSTKESNKSQHKPKSLLLQGRNSEVGITTKTDECSNPGVGLLCEEPLVEEASAHSPQEAVTQCRAGTQEDSKEQSLHSAKPDSLEECEVQTNLKIWTEPINIEFTEDGLSYMDKLWLKKHRKTLKEQPDMFLHPPATTASTGEVQTSQNENGDESDVEEINVKYPPLFMPVEELDIVRPEPSLTIVQLDDTYEEEYEEKGNIVPYKVELPESQLSITFPNYQKNCFLCESDMCLHRVFNKGRLNLSHLCLRSSPTCYNDDLKAEASNTDCDNFVDSNIDSPDTEKIGENSSSEGNLEEKNINPENIRKTDDSCISLGSKDFLPTTNLDTIFIKEIFSERKQESLEFTNLPKKPCSKDSKNTKSSLLLQEIARRNKPANEQYQGLEWFFTFNQNEKLNLVPSQSLQSSCSSSKMTLAGQKAQRPTTANLPLSNSVKKVSSCLPSPHGRSRSVAAQILSRAASEISEIEYIDGTDLHGASLDHTADQQTLDTLEKELSVMRNLTGSSEKLSSLSTEELLAFKHNWLSMSEIFSDFPITSDIRSPCGTEELSSSGKDTGIHSLLTLSDYSTDEDEENFLDKQQVMTLPWSKSS